ncbi:MAG: hypothetical protein Q4B81_05100 [Moraxella sp.]|nr:hypothetical protein [Moraxella sp.]
MPAHHPFFHQTNTSTKQFTLTATATNAPQIHVVASTQGDTLQLSYYIKQCDWLDLPFCSTNEPERQDFLWENHCLECFFDLQNTNAKSYFEMNYSPKGAFNLYRFDDYRTPSTLPPVWADGSVMVMAKPHPPAFYVYHLKIKLGSINQMSISNINPATILYRDGTPIFYAVQHASPPDFHDKAFWQTLA